MNKDINIKQIKKNVSASIGAQAVSLCVSLLMNLFVPKFISQYQYAYWQSYLLYVNYVGILHFGLLDGLVLRYSQYNYEELDKPRIRSQFLVLLVLVNFFSILVLLITLSWTNSNLRQILVFVAIGIISKNLFTYTSYMFQITNRISLYAKLVIYTRLMYGVLVSILLVLQVHEFYWFCIIDIASDLSGVLLGILINKDLYIGKVIGLKNTIDEAILNISSGIKLMIATWSSILLTGGARMIIQWVWGQIIFANASFAFSIINLFLTFVTALSVVLFPSLKRIDPTQINVIFSKLDTFITPLLFNVMFMYFPGCMVLNVWLPKYKPSLFFLAMLLPIIVYSTKTNLINNNILKTFRQESYMQRVNLYTVIISLSLFLISGYVFKSVNCVLLTLSLSIMVAEIISEKHVMNLFQIKKNRIIYEEMAMTLVFIVSSIFLPSKYGAAVYLITLILYDIYLIKGKNRKTA